MAKLTKTPEKFHNAYGITTARGNLDENGEKQEGMHIIKKEIRILGKGEKINV